MFCAFCGNKISNSIDTGITDSDGMDEINSSIEQGMRVFEIDKSSCAYDSFDLQLKLQNQFMIIEEIIEYLKSFLTNNFCKLTIDFYLAVKYKRKEGETILVIDKKENWEKFNETLIELDKQIIAQDRLLSSMKPSFFDNREKKRMYNLGANKLADCSTSYIAMREEIFDYNEIKFLEE